MTLVERTAELLKEAGSNEDWIEDIRSLIEKNYPSSNPDCEDFEELSAHEIATDIAMMYDLDIEIPDMELP